MRPSILLAFGLLAAPAVAADLATIDRSIKKEPIYATKSPQYCLLVFGPETRDRVWLVHDGDVLYVDRNGNGDLTEAGERVGVEEGGSKEQGFSFAAGDLTAGGKTHKGLAVTFIPLKLFAGNPSLTSVAAIRDALKADPGAVAVRVSVDVESARFKGAGIGGRVMQLAGYFDPAGVLTFAAKPADAPVVHFDGPLQVNFYGEVPSLRLARDNDLVLVIGSPGKGGGTFAMLAYQDTIPADAYPKVEVHWPGDPPVNEHFELKERC
jgi:hypothetical protein